MAKKLVIVLSVFVGLVSICISGCESPEQEVKKLIQALQHKNSQVRHAAAGELGKIGENAIDAVPALIQALQDPVANVRSNAAGILGQIGEGAVDAVPALTLALQDLAPEVRQYVAGALGEIGSGAAYKHCRIQI